MNEPLRTDGELLAEFSDAGSEPALAELMARHGPMVHGVALRVLADHHEAQDVTQAVFCTLARKAKRLRKDASVGGWLHRVAWCLAMDIKSSRTSRKRREEETMRAQTDALRESEREGQFREELDDALNRLPERYRQPLVLFHIEGHSLDATAQMLGLNAGTVGSQLSRAREMLRTKLVRRGVAVGSVGALTTLLSAEAGAAALPATFVSATVKAASLAAAGQLAAGVGAGALSADVAALTKGAANMLFWNSVKATVVAVSVTGAVVGTGTVVAQKAMDANPSVGVESKPTTVEPLDQHDDLPDYEMGPYPYLPKLPDDEQAFLRKADETLAARKFSEAMGQYNSFLHDYPKSLALPYALILKGRCFDKIGTLASATKTYEEVLDYFPVSVAYCAPSLFYQARIAVKTGDLVRAKRLLAELEKDDQYSRHDVLLVARRLKAIIEKMEGATRTATFTEVENGKTVSVPVGQEFEIHLTNGREGAGWEPGATEITGKSVVRVDKLRRMNCDEFIPANPSTNGTKGMYVYRYKAVTTGESHLRLTHLYPSGPKPVPRTATMLIGEFKLTIVVREDGSAATEAVTTGNLKDWVAFVRNGEYQKNERVKITEETSPTKRGEWTIRKGLIAGLPIEFNGDRNSESRRVILRAIPMEQSEHLVAVIRETWGKETTVKGAYHTWSTVSGGPRITDQMLLQFTLNEDAKTPNTLIFMVFFGPNAAR